MTYIGVDLGGSHVTCALVSRTAIIARRHALISDNSSLAALLPRLEDSICVLLSHPEAGACEGIAFSFCGIVAGETGQIIQTNGKYHDAANINLPQWSRTHFGLELRVENDARTALLGERENGAARGFEDIVMIILGTGVGGAAMIGGKLLRGKHSQAGCLLGHFGCDRHGHLCTCGNIGCVEAEASTSALKGICHQHPRYAESPLADLQNITFQDLFSMARAGDACALEVREQSIQVWAAGAVSWIHAYDPEVIVFGGGVMSESETILPALATHIHRHAWTPWGKVAVRKAELGNDASLFAGSALFKAQP